GKMGGWPSVCETAGSTFHRTNKRKSFKSLSEALKRRREVFGERASGSRWPARSSRITKARSKLRAGPAREAPSPCCCRRRPNDGKNPDCRRRAHDRVGPQERSEDGRVRRGSGARWRIRL